MSIDEAERRRRDQVAWEFQRQQEWESRRQNALNRGVAMIRLSPRIFALARLTTCGSDGWGDHFDGNVIARGSHYQLTRLLEAEHMKGIPVEKNPDNHFGKE